MKTLLFLTCFSVASAAEGASNLTNKHPDPRPGQTPHAIQMDESFPIEKLEEDGVEVHPLSEVGSLSQMIPASLQEQFFQEAGLYEFVKNWDGFEKDRLALRAENQAPNEVAARYGGQLPEPAIRKLKKIIGEYRSHQ